MKLFLITGSSGVGKSTILPFLKEHLSNYFDVHDFDEKLTMEVAMNGNLLNNWRLETTKYWINLAEENLKSNKNTVIIGLVHPNEIKQLDIQIPYSLCLLDASDEKIKERLMGNRFSNDYKIAGLKQGTGKTPEEFIQENKLFMEKLREDTKAISGDVIDTTEDNQEHTASKVLSWILKNNFMESESLKLARTFLGKKVKLEFDQQVGSSYAPHGIDSYPINYGYVPGVLAPDRDDLDAYLLNVFVPLKEAEGVCIAIIHRLEDDDDKLIVVPEGTQLTDEEIIKQVAFQEHLYKGVVVR
ncbi:MAG: inorganic diphosphatase [bacterium]